MKTTNLIYAALGSLLIAGPALAQSQMEMKDRQDRMERPRGGDSMGEMERERGGNSDRPWVPGQNRDGRFADNMRGERVAVQDWLKEAQEAVRQGNFGRANEFLERAATRMLSRGTEASRAGEAMESRSLRHINDAREALRHRDRREAMRQIDMALSAG
ncbi:MAG: hypothetical protein JWR10_2711 [Rubritepida sp.]|nr:hypothetical protein [Rubritepida sp.]